MRTLPLRLAPVAGESLPGYITRYAGHFALQPGDVVRALGLDDGRRTHGLHGVWLAPERLRGVAHAAGLDPEAVEGMQIAVFAGRAFRALAPGEPVTLAREVAAREVSTCTTRVCPICLREDGAFRLRWQLAWSVACPEHRVLLVRRCPRCGQPPRVGARSRWPRDEQGELTDTTRCAHRRRHGKLCRARLTGRAAVVAASPKLVAAQRRIDALFDGQLTPTLAGEALEAPVWLRDLRALAMLVRAEAQPTTEARSERVCGGSLRPLDDPLSLGAVLPAALALADLPDPGALTDALRAVLDRHYETTGAPLAHAGRRRRMSATLDTALRRAASEASYANASTRLGFDPRAHRRPADLDARLQARHVPQLFWAADYERRLACLFDFDDFSPWLARRFCSVLLARMLAPLDWRAAVAYLDFPAHFHNDGYNTTFVKLRSAGRFDELATRVKAIANEHAERGLVDYKQRRALLCDWSGIDPATWRLLAPRTRARNPDTPARASLWLWCQLTSGDERAAPIMPSRPELRRQTDFVRRHIPALHEPLTLLGKLLLATPADARRTLTNRLAAALHESGQSRPRSRLSSIDPLLSERVLAHTSAHTGVDLATLTTPSVCSSAPAAVTHARTLAAALLRETAHASWAAVAGPLGGSGSRLAVNDRAYRATLAAEAALASELEQLANAIADWQTPAPAVPDRPHRERMAEVAAAIKEHAADLLPAGLATRASIVACHAHTDLTWPQIAELHAQPAHPALSRATVAHHRNDPDLDERYQQLLEHARRARNAAGFATARLGRGLTSPPRQEDR